METHVRREGSGGNSSQGKNPAARTRNGYVAKKLLSHNPPFYHSPVVFINNP
jgi:hypothetical protein